MKPTFLGHKRPLLVDMIIVETPTDCVIHTRNAIYDGAEAFGIQMERLLPQYRTEDTLTKMFAYMEDKPIYVTNYRGGHNKDMTDEARMEELKLAYRCGATLLDVPGDTFDKNAPAPLELSRERDAVEKQKKLIYELHEMGAEVLMSSHIFHYLPKEEVIELALAQQERGADIAKFVTGAATEEELWDNMNLIRELKKELKIPFLFLANGAYCKPQRVLGPYAGCCMWLCVDTYDKFSSREQPLLRSMSEIVRNFDITPNLREL